MEVSVENTGALARKMTVQIPAEEIESKVDSRIREMGRSVRLKGFRPGRVPFKVLRQRFGQQVRQEVVGEVIQESFQRAVVENDLRPVSTPEFNADAESGEGLEYTASFEVFPEIDELKASELKIEKPVAEVTEKDVDQMIATLREQRRTWEDKDGAAEEGDLVFFHYSVELEDGRFPEGDENVRAGAVVGHGAFDVEFEKHLVGMAADDEKTFEVEFTKGARENELAGKKGKASVRLEKVQETRLPEVDEEFVESFGITDGGIDQFRIEVRQNLERELKQNLGRRTREQVIDQLIDLFPDLEIPEGMVENEMKAMRQQAAARIEQVGGDASSVPPEESFREQAEKRVRGALLISEVARHAELEIDMGRVRDKVNEIAATYEDSQAVAQLYYQREDLLSGIRNIVLEEQAVEWVLDQANVKEVEKSFDDVMNPQAPDASDQA